jgi:dihydroorotate dehydrogenase
MVTRCRRFFCYDHHALHQKIWGIEFPNPVGLAAGFDKFARGVRLWSDLGFGFAEVGTVTAVAQDGNPKPRLFRLISDRALINRFGFNNSGAEATAAVLNRQMKTGIKIPIGINIGKSKITDLDKAAGDYAASFSRLWPLADYFVVNVSSPNTPNLRQLQDRPRLTEILSQLTEVNRSGGKPILLKIAPDLSWSQIDDVVSVLNEFKLAGVVATNTTVDRTGLRSRLSGEAGGLSGAPLRQRATDIIRHLFRALGRNFVIIGVGGIFNSADAYEKILAGASLVQIYTGFVYEGPSICRSINKGLVKRLRADGFSNLRDAVGQKT